MDYAAYMKKKPSALPNLADEVWQQIRQMPHNVDQHHGQALFEVHHVSGVAIAGFTKKSVAKEARNLLIKADDEKVYEAFAKQPQRGSGSFFVTRGQAHPDGTAKRRKSEHEPRRSRKKAKPGALVQSAA